MNITPASVVNQRLALAAAQLKHNDNQDITCALAARYAVVELLGAALCNYLLEIGASPQPRQTGHSGEDLPNSDTPMASLTPATAGRQWQPGSAEFLRSCLNDGGGQPGANLMELRTLAERPESWLASLLELLATNQTCALFAIAVDTPVPTGVIATSAENNYDNNSDKTKAKLVLPSELCPWLYREFCSLIQRQREALQEY